LPGDWGRVVFRWRVEGATTCVANTLDSSWFGLIEIVIRADVRFNQC
jgi:hypothetical protein